MGKVVKVLEVFYEATVRLSSSSACISDVVPTVTSLIVALGPGDGEKKRVRVILLSLGASDNGVKDFKRKLKASLLERLGNKEDLERYSLATLLDPRYDKSLFS